MLGGLETLAPLLLDAAETARHRIARRALLLAGFGLAVYVFMLGALGALGVALFVVISRHTTAEEAALVVAGASLLGAVLSAIPIVRWVRPRHRPPPLPPAGIDPLAAPAGDPLAQTLAQAAALNRMKASEILVAGAVAGFVYEVMRGRRRP